MKALWQIILAFLWRLRPVQALEVNLRDIIELGLAMFADDHELERLTADPAYRAKIAAAMVDAHRKLDLLVYLRACELTGVTKRLGFKPNYSHTHASTDLIALWRSFERLIAKFDDYERYAQKRAESLRRDPPAQSYGGPLRLDATHRSTSPGFAGGGLRDDALCPPSRETRGRWRAHACARDGGGCVLARGPPSIPLSELQLQLTSQPPARTPLHIKSATSRNLRHISPAPLRPLRNRPKPNPMTTRAKTLRLKKQAIKRLAPARRD